MFPLYCSRQCVQGEARLASIFLGLRRVLLRCRVCVRLRSCFAVRSFEKFLALGSRVGHLQREGARTGRFPFVSVVRGVARFLRWCYCGMWRLTVIGRVSMLNW